MFKPGQSGNPGGRRKKSDEQIKFERRCREYMDTFGFDKIRNWANSNDAKKSQWALDRMLEYGFLKPAQSLEVTTHDEAGASPEELASQLAAAIGDSAFGSSQNPSPDQVEPGK